MSKVIAATPTVKKSYTFGDIQMIKDTLGFDRLNFVRGKKKVENDVSDTADQWLSHWDDDTRTRVNLHQDVFVMVKADPGINVLFISRDETKQTQSGDNAGIPYRNIIISATRDVEFSI